VVTTLTKTETVKAPCGYSYDKPAGQSFNF